MASKRLQVMGVIPVNEEDYGKSAYELAVDHGFEGSEEEWLESLKGKDGVDGVDGKNTVYVGSGEMPEDCNVQIDPDGDALTLQDIVNDVIASLPVYNGEVV